jgi:site-specific recombinase XerD
VTLPCGPRLQARDQTAERCGSEADFVLAEFAHVESCLASSSPSKAGSVVWSSRSSSLLQSKAVIHVKGKGGKDRTMPVEAELLSVIEAYLESRAIRFPSATKRRSDVSGSPLSRWPTRYPLFVGRDGERISRATVQSRVKRAFKRAGADAQPVPGALVHGLRHTYATELAGL